MIVSLEAIFLSTFVMISQNRADAKRQVLADHQWEIVQTEEKQNEDLLDDLEADPRADQAIHALTTQGRPAAPAGGPAPGRPRRPVRADQGSRSRTRSRSSTSSRRRRRRVR